MKTLKAQSPWRLRVLWRPRFSLRHWHIAVTAFVLGMWALLAVSPAQAGWSANGVRLSQGNGASAGDIALTKLRLVPDGAGGAIAVWSNRYRVFAQRVTATGDIAPGWPANGVVACIPPIQFPGQEAGPNAVTDGAGGAIIAWHDTRQGDSRIFAQRITASGARAWPDAGLQVSDNPVSEAVLAADNLGGVYITWIGQAYEIRATHLDSNGVPVAGWNLSGNLLAAQSVHAIQPAVISDGVLGAIIAWSEHPSNWSIYALRVQSDGSVAPGWPARGTLVCQGPNDRYNMTAVTDGAGGVMLAWPDYRSGSSIDSYGSRVTSAGSLAAGLTTAGSPLSTAIGDQGNLTNYNPPRQAMASDDAGGALIAWMDTRNGAYDVYGSRIGPDGSIAPGWATNGNPIAATTDDQLFPVMARDGNGGAFVAWTDRRDEAQFDIYYAHMSSAGVPITGQPANGVPLCTASGDQIPPSICEDGAQGALVAWEDFRSGQDIYATRIYTDVLSVRSLPTGLTIRGIHPNPSSGPLRVSFSLPSDHPATLELIDAAGRRIAARAVGTLGAGEHVMSLSERVLPAGIYFVRLSQDSRSVTTRAAMVH